MNRQVRDGDWNEVDGENWDSSDKVTKLLWITFFKYNIYVTLKLLSSFMKTRIRVMGHQ